jgi:hypothetical protein
MIIIEYFELKFQKTIRENITRRPINQYLISSLLGTIPGCIDAFFIVSLYTHGLVGFGALVSVMLSTAGDEAFIMLTMIPKAAFKIITICLVLGVIGGLLADIIIKLLNVKIREHCIIEIHEDQTNLHFLREHVYNHILRKHVPRLFLWIFIPLTIVDFLMINFDLASKIEGLPVVWLIIIAAIIGVIPESGPHMIFLILYSKGMLPFSVLLVSTLSQDGHGLLPLLSHSIKDTIYVQLFTTGFSLLFGIFLYLIGI